MNTVIHQPEKNRFALDVEGKTAHIDYMKVGSTLIFTHTEVPESLEGKGIGGQLAKTALDYVRDQGLSAAPLCPFVKGYLEKHPEYHALVRLKSR